MTSYIIKGNQYFYSNIFKFKTIVQLHQLNHVSNYSPQSQSTVLREGRKMGNVNSEIKQSHTSFYNKF